MRVVIFILVGMLALGEPARAENHDASASSLERLTGQPGVEMTQHKDGSATVTVWTKNGVSITMDGSKSSVWVNDNTGKGAVGCIWMMDVSVKAGLEVCRDARFAELRRDLDVSIAAIDRFIVANSFDPVTIEQMHAREEAQYSAVRRKAEAFPASVAGLCEQGDYGRMVSYLNAMSHKQRQKMLSDLLSIPRWPALNPCL